MLRFTPEDKCGINKFKLRKKMKTYTFRVVVEPMKTAGLLIAQSSNIKGELHGAIPKKKP
jgi:hypothetical protein